MKAVWAVKAGHNRDQIAWNKADYFLCLLVSSRIGVSELWVLIVEHLGSSKGIFTAKSFNSYEKLESEVIQCYYTILFFTLK